MPASLKEIIKSTVLELRELGFKGSGQNYRLASDNAVCVINFQKSSGGMRFYVNVGVQPLFVPTQGESDPDPKKIKEPECIFRMRIDPPSDDMLGWPYTMEVALELTAKIKSTYDSFIQPLMTIPGPITEVTVADFDANEKHPLFGGRHARTFLMLSRIAAARGDEAKAREFASEGIAICPERATWVLYQLKKAGG